MHMATFDRVRTENHFTRFVTELEQSGFAAFLAAFPAYSVNPGEWARRASALDADLGRLVDLLLLGRPVAKAGLPAAVRAVLPELGGHGVLAEDDTAVCLLDVALFRPLGRWLFAEPPSPFRPRHYFGADSLALAGHAVRRPGQTVLDLCAGTGLQGLVAAFGARHVDMVEIDPLSAQVARLNVLMNGVADRVDVHCGDLYGPLAAMARFEHVVANIPFVPGADGGRDGFDVGRAILADLHRRLDPGGTAHLSAMLLRAGDEVLMRDELVAWATAAKCGVTVVLTNYVAVDADSDLVRSTAEDLDELDYDEAATQVAALYADQGATAASLAFLTVHAGTTPGVRLLDLGRDNPRPGTPWV